MTDRFDEMARGICQKLREYAGHTILVGCQDCLAIAAALLSVDAKARLDEAAWWEKRRAHRRCIHCRTERQERIAERALKEEGRG